MIVLQFCVFLHLQGLHAGQFILAVPDVAIGAVAREVVPLMQPGELLQ